MKAEEVCVLEEDILEAQLFEMEVEEMLGEEICALEILDMTGGYACSRGVS